MMSEINLPLIRVYFKTKSKETQNLPRYLYSSFRGALGARLKKLSCVARKISSCLQCPLNQYCAYGYIFETPRPKETERLRLYPYLPHPFAITLPHVKTCPAWNIGLTLVGKAIQYFPHFVLAIRATGQIGLGPKRGRFEISEIIDHFTREKLYEKGKLKSPNLETKWKSRKVKRIKLNFETPLTLKYQESFVSPEKFSFHILIRNLLRRISALSFFHADKELILPFKEIIKEAENILIEEKNLKVFSIKRYSARKKQEMPLRGLIGEVTIRGDLRTYYPLLKLGELLHVGKHTSFGFGKYQLEILET